MTAAYVQPHASWAGAITDWTFWKLKQITIRESLGVGKRAFLATSRLLLHVVITVYYTPQQM